MNYSTRFKLILVLILSYQLILAQTKSTYENQKAFTDLRFGMFIHFNLGTFTDEEWAKPNQNPKLFAPSKVDCDQWAAAAKSAGMKFGVLTTKHHDGFALWPTKYGKKNAFGTYQNVMSSGYPHDVVQLYMDAFRKAGLIPCLYFSIWDRTEGIDSSHCTQANLDLIVGEITELLTNYGDIPLLMFDGWTWKTGRNVVPYQLIRETVKKLQPNCLIADHNGLTQPFEEDILNFEHFEVPTGNTFAATRGTTIMPKWFWHTGYDALSPMAASTIASRLNGTQANWANFLLDCPPNRNGVLDANVVNRLKEAGSLWKLNTTRGTMPVPNVQLEHPVTPIKATATSNSYYAGLAIDGTNDFVSGADVQTLWHSSSAPSTSVPQSVTLDFGKIYNNIELLEYMPSQERTVGNDITTVNLRGHITSYNIYVSVDNKTFTKVASGTWVASGFIKKVQFAATIARYIRLEATGTSGGGPAIISEIDAGGVTNKPSVVVVTDLEQETVGQSGVMSFPNPFSESMMLKAKGYFGYIIYDARGLELERGNVQEEKRVGSDLPGGIYVIKVTTALGTDYLKVIKN
jgi:alpha-L-fucosidase